MYFTFVFVNILFCLLFSFISRLTIQQRKTIRKKTIKTKEEDDYGEDDDDDDIITILIQQHKIYKFNIVKKNKNKYTYKFDLIHS
jgi:hypothetical protein